MWTAAGVGDIESVKDHLARVLLFDIDAIDKTITMTPLLAAALMGQTEMVEFLIRKGADVDAKGGDGGTALHAAAFLGQYEVAKLLIENGADINARNNDGATVMDTLVLDRAILPEMSTQYRATDLPNKQLILIPQDLRDLIQIF